MKNKILILIIIIMSALIIIKPKETSANNAKFNIWIEVGGKQQVSRQELDDLYETKYETANWDLFTGLPVSIWIESTSGSHTISVLGFNLLAGELGFGNIETEWIAIKEDAQAGWRFGIDGSLGNSIIIEATASPYFVEVTTTPRRFSNFLIDYDLASAIEDDELMIEFDSAADTLNRINYTSSDFNIQPFIIGNPQSGPNTNLSGLTAKSSNNPTLAVTGPTDNKYTVKKASNDLSYSDTQGLSFTPVAADSGATIKVTKEGLTTEIPRQGDGSYIVGPLSSTTTFDVVVTNDGAMSPYKVEIKVQSVTGVALSSVNFGNGDASLSPSFSPTTKNYTLKLFEGNTDLNISAVSNPAGLNIVYSKQSGTFTNNEKFTITVSTPDGSMSETYNFTVSVRQKSTDNTIHEIDVDGNIFTFSGSSTTGTHTINENISSFEFSVVTDPKATVKIGTSNNSNVQTGTLATKGSSRTFTIEVTSESGDPKTYSFTVKRAESSVAKLSSLDIHGKHVSLQENVYNYEYVLDNKTGLMSVLSPTVENGTVKVFYQPNGQVEQEVTNNPYDASLVKTGDRYRILVTAANGTTTQNYYITMNVQSEEKDIETFVITNTTPNEIMADFVNPGLGNYQFVNTPGTKNYSLTFPYSAETDRIEMNVVTSPKSKIIIGQTTPNNLSMHPTQNTLVYAWVMGVGTKTTTSISFELIVEAENGNRDIYNYTITREKADDNNLLSELKIDGQSISNNFTPNTFVYETIYYTGLDDETTTKALLFTATPQKSTSRVQLKISTDSLTSSSEIFKKLDGYAYIIDRAKLYTFQVVVISESGSEQSYTFKVLIANNIADAEVSLQSGITVTSNTTSGNITTIKATAPFSYDTARLTILLEDYKSKITVTSGVIPNDRVLALNNAGQMHFFSFTVTSENGQVEKIYNLEITREAGDDFKEINSLTLSYGSTLFTFDLKDSSGNHLTYYKYRIDYEFDIITLTAKVSGSRGESFIKKNAGETTYTVSNKILDDGNNRITFDLFDENGKKQEYVVDIVRANNNSDFSGVKVHTYDIEGVSSFVNGVGNYGGEIVFTPVSHSVSQVTFFIHGLDQYAKVNFILGSGDIIRNQDLGSFKWDLTADLVNEIVFQVEAQDGTKGKEYSIKLERKQARQEKFISEMKVTTYGNDEVIEEITKTNLSPGETLNLIIGKVNNGKAVIVFKILIEHNSTVDYIGLPPEIVGDYYVYTHTINGSNLDNDFSIKVSPEDTTKAANEHVIKFITKSTNDEIEDIKIFVKPTGDTSTFYEFDYDFSSHGISEKLITLPYSTEKIRFEITKGDSLSRVVRNTSNISPENENNKYYTYEYSKNTLPGDGKVNFKLLSEYQNTLLKPEYGIQYNFRFAFATPSYENSLIDLEFSVGGDNKITFNQSDLSFVSERIEKKENYATIKAYVLEDDLSVVVGFHRQLETITGPGNKQWVLFTKQVELKDDGFYDIEVKNEFGSSQTYKITYVRSSDKNDVDYITFDSPLLGNHHVLQGELYSSTSNNPIKLPAVPNTSQTITISVGRDDLFSDIYIQNSLVAHNSTHKEVSFTFNLNEGKRVYQIYLVSEFGTKSNHTIFFEIERKEASSITDLDLLEIISDGENLVKTSDFSPSNTKYQYLISPDVSNQVRINITAKDTLSKVTLITEDFRRYSTDGVIEDVIVSLSNTGELAANEIIINVLAEDGSEVNIVIYLYYAYNTTTIEDISLVLSTGIVQLTDLEYNETKKQYEVPWDFGEVLNFDYNKLDPESIVTLMRGEQTYNSNLPINDEMNNYKIIVKSHYASIVKQSHIVSGESVIPEEYVINIYKHKAKDDTKLDNLKVLNGVTNNQINFHERDFQKNEENNRDYVIKLTEKVESIKFEVTTKGDYQVVSYPEGIIEIQYEEDDTFEHSYEIIVTAEGAEGTYRVLVQYGKDYNTDSSAKDVIKLDGPFGNYEYNRNNYNENNRLEIFANDIYLRVVDAKNDAAATYKTDLFELKDGENDLKLVIYAEDKSISTEYILYVNKIAKSGENRIQELEIKFGQEKYEFDHDQSVIKLNQTLDFPYVNGNFSYKILLKDSVNAKYKVDVPDEFDINILNIVTITVVAENGDILVYRITLNFKEKQADIELGFKYKNDPITPVNSETINVTGGIQQTIYLPDLDYSQDEITITVKNDFNATIDGEGTHKLIPGIENEIIITSLSQDEKTKNTYIVKVTRLNGEDDNTLSYLNVSIDKPSDTTIDGNRLPFEQGAFDPEKNSYLIKVNPDLNIEYVRVNATPTNPKSTVKGAGNEQYRLSTEHGVTFIQIEIIVTSETGLENVYIIKVTKAYSGDKSDNTEINDTFEIIGQDKKPYTYNKNIYDENNPLVIDSSNSFFRISNAEKDAGASLENYIFDELEPGEVKEIPVVIIAEDGTRETHNIYVKRAELDSDTSLSELKVEYAGKVEYHKFGTDINAPIDLNLEYIQNRNSVTITVKTTSTKSKYEVHNTIVVSHELNVVTITVVAENGDIEEHRIRISFKDGNAEIDLEFKDNNKATITETNRVENDITDNEKEVLITLETVSYHSNSLEIIVKNKGKALVSGDGVKTLVINDNDFEVISTSEDGTKVITYKISIIRTEGKDYNYLDSLEVTAGTKLDLEFDKDTFEYSFKLEKSSTVGSINIIATTPEAERATIISGNGVHQFTSIDGGPEFVRVQIVVESEIGTKRIYTVTVSKTLGEAASNNTDIKDQIELHGKNEVYEYDFTVNDIDNPLEINMEDDYLKIFNANVSPTASMLSNIYENIKQGETHEIKVIIVAEDGTRKTHLVYVLREGLSNNTDIKDKIDIIGKDSTYEYDFTINDINNPLVIDSQDDFIKIGNVLVDTNATLNNNIFEINKQGEVSAVEIIITAENGDEETHIIYIERKEFSDDNTLSDLVIEYNGKLVTPEFNGSVDDEILITLPRDAKTFNKFIATTNHDRAKATISDYEITEGAETLITITVIAENGSPKVYKVKAITKDNKVNIGFKFTLSSGQVLNPIQTFNTVTNEFEIDLGTVGHAETDLTIEVINKESLYILVFGEYGRSILDVGTNEFVITSQSEDGLKENIYTINIEREEGDEDNLLENIIVTSTEGILEFEETFSPTVNNYNIVLDLTSNITHVDIEAVLPSGSKATIKGDGTDIRLNTVNDMIIHTTEIIVTSETGVDNIYKIQIVKALSGDLSPDNKVNAINVRGLNTDEVHSYLVDTANNGKAIVVNPRDEFVAIEVETNHKKAIVEGKLTYKLTSGQTITATIKVKSEDGTKEKDYVIIITREKSFTDLEDLFVNNLPVDDLTDGKYDYIIPVSGNPNFVTIDATLPKEAEANIDFPYTLQLGTEEETLKFTVTAADGRVVVYELLVKKTDYVVDISSIKIDDVDSRHLFMPSYTYNWPDTLAYKDGSFKIQAMTEDITSRVYIVLNGIVVGEGIMDTTTLVDLKVGNNVIKIYANSESGKKGNEYTINVVREEASDNNLLDDLIIRLEDQNGQIVTKGYDFYPETNQYTLELADLGENIASLFIQAVKGQVDQLITGTGKVDLGFTANEGLMSQVIEVKVIAENGNERIYKLIVVREINPNADISVNEFSLRGNDGVNYLGLGGDAPEDNKFSSSNYLYNVTIPYGLERITLNAINYNGAKVTYINSASGVYSLANMGTSFDLSFYLTSNDGTINNRDNPYIIRITKEDASDDNTLSVLTINDLAVTGFNPGKTNYEYIIDSDSISSIKIGGEANHERAKVVGFGIKYLTASASNVFDITVTAENGDVRVYTIIVKSQSSDNKIYDIVVEGFEDLRYIENKYEYSMSVPFTVERINLVIDAHEKATLSISGMQNLVEGENIFEIYATSESGEKGSLYKLTITRERVDGENRLDNLVVKDYNTGIVIPYNPVFNPDNKLYVIELKSGINSTTAITIEANPMSKYSSVTGTGLHYLDTVGTEGGKTYTYQIGVKAQDGSSNTYTLIVYKDVEGIDGDARLNDLSLTEDGIDYYLAKENATNEFKNNKYVYEIEVPYYTNSLTLSAKTEASLAFVEINGENKLTVNKSFKESDTIEFEVIVLSSNGRETLTYTVIVTKGVANSNNLLGEIRINNKPLANFDSEKDTYTITISPEETKNIKIDAIVADLSATIISGLGTFVLEEGIVNSYIISVQAEDGSRKDYKIHVLHPSNESTLEDLIIKDENGKEVDLDFESNKFEYSITVPLGTQSINFDAIAKDNNSFIVGTGTKYLDQSLKVNTITLTVLADDGITEKTYTVNVHFDGEQSSDGKLKDIVFKDVDFTFREDQLYYEISVGNLSDIKILELLTSNQFATVKVRGDGSTKTGNNTVIVTVTSQDGTDINTYQFDLIVEGPQNLTYLILLILTFLLWFVTVIVIIFKRNKDKGNEHSDIIY